MRTRESVSFQPSSDQSLLLYFDETTALAAHERIRKLLHSLAVEPFAAARNFQPAYRSLLVEFDALTTTHAQLETALCGRLARLEHLELPAPRQVEIPTCYGGEFGPHLDEVARLHGVSPDRVVELHSSVTYIVYFFGFVPGFAYLGDLPEALATPRLPSPRRTTAPGSVGIADRQTGVYPAATPGGWRLIGRTPIPMFRPGAENMSFLNLGDRVRFVPISSAQFSALRGA